MVVNNLASNSATLPRSYQDEDGEVIDNSEIERLLNKPNNYQSRIEFLQTVNEYLALSGNAFIRHIEGVGAGNDIEVLDSAKVRILLDSSGQVSGYDYIDNMGKRRSYDNETVLHIKMSSNLDTERDLKFWGLSPLRALWTIVESSNDLFTARASIWKNKGIIGIITNKSDVPLLPKERQQLQDKFDQDIGGADKANKAHVTSGDLSFIQTGMSPSDLKLLEGNIDNLRMISSGYKIPSVIFNDVENSTYNNVLESKRGAYTDAYIPLANKVDEKLSVWLSEKLGVEEFIVIDVSRIEVLKLTTNDVANRLNEMSPQLQNRVVGQMSSEEVRGLIGLIDLANGEEVIGDAKSPVENPPKD
jgi:HK97 family phage portal protein